MLIFVEFIRYTVLAFKWVIYDNKHSYKNESNLNFLFHCHWKVSLCDSNLICLWLIYQSFTSLKDLILSLKQVFSSHLVSFVNVDNFLLCPGISTQYCVYSWISKSEMLQDCHLISIIEKKGRKWQRVWRKAFTIQQQSELLKLSVCLADLI